MCQCAEVVLELDYLEEQGHIPVGLPICFGGNHQYPGGTGKPPMARIPAMPPTWVRACTRPALSAAKDLQRTSGESPDLLLLYCIRSS